MQIEKLLTDHGRPFTNRFTRKNKTPSDPHACDHECALLGIEQRLTKPRPLQTHGRVERFNGRLSGLLAIPRFRSRDDLPTTLDRYEKLDNEHLPQRALGHKTPLQAIRTWRQDRPELLDVRRIRRDGTPSSWVLWNHRGPDS